MFLRVHVLDVVKEKVGALRGVDDDALLREAAGVHAAVIALHPAGVERVDEEFRLHERFSAGECDAAGAEEYLVLLELRHKLLYRVGLSAELARLGRAGLAAFSAACAERLVSDERAAADGNRAVRADLDAGPAGYALLRTEEHRRPDGLALRVVAPPAGERAALKMHRRARPGPVVDGIFLDVEYDSVVTQSSRSPPPKCPAPHASRSNSGV